MQWQVSDPSGSTYKMLANTMPFPTVNSNIEPDLTMDQEYQALREPLPRLRFVLGHHTVSPRRFFAEITPVRAM